MIRLLTIAALLNLGVIMNQGPDEHGAPNGGQVDLNSWGDASGTDCSDDVNCVFGGTTCSDPIDDSPDAPDDNRIATDEASENVDIQVIRFVTPVRDLSTATNAIGVRVLVSKCDDCNVDAGGGDPNYTMRFLCDDLGLGVTIASAVTVTGTDQLDSYNFTYKMYGPGTSSPTNGIGCAKDGGEIEIQFTSTTAGAGADERSVCVEAIELLYEYGDMTNAELAPDSDTENSAVFGLGDGTDCTDDTACDATDCEDAVDEDPESKDSNFLIADSDNDTMYFGFPTPATAPSLAVGAQTFQITLSRGDGSDCSTGTGDSQYGVRMYCGTSFLINLFRGFRVHGDDQIARFSWTFPNSGFCENDGSNVRLRFESIDLTAQPWRPIIEAVEWEVGY